MEVKNGYFKLDIREMGAENSSKSKKFWNIWNEKDIQDFS